MINLEIENKIVNKCFDIKGRYIIKHKPLTEEENKYVLNKYNDSLSIRESIYRIKLNIDIHPTCPICGNLCETTFLPSKLFKSTCGNKLCSNKLRQINVQKTIKEKYGVSCVFSLDQIRKNAKQTCLEKYGTYNNLEKIKETCLKKYGVDSIGKVKQFKEKAKQTCLEKYGVENPYQIKEVVKKIQEKRNDKIDTIKSKLSKAYNSKRDWRIQRFKEGFLNKYGVDNPSKVPEILQKSINTRIKLYGHLYNEEQYVETSLERYGVSHPMKTKDNKIKLSYIGKDPIVMQKKYDTMKRNHTFNSSKPEEFTFKLLKERYKEIKREYNKDKRYPWRCDFYIPKIDTFIELQGYYTHGKHPFNINSEEDQHHLTLLKEKYKTYFEIHKKWPQIITIWTENDVIKRNKAKEENLNYIEIFSTKEEEILEILKNEKIL